MIAAMKLKNSCSLEGKLWQIWHHIKKQRHHFADKGPYSQSYRFSSSQVWIWELDHKEGWMPKNWWFWTVVLEKTLESPLDCRKIKLVNPKGNQHWILIGRADVESEATIFWPLDEKCQLIGKEPNSGKDWRQEKQQTTEDDMVECHHQCNGHEFEQTGRKRTGKPAVLQSMGSQSVGHEIISPKKAMASHSSTLAWKIPWMEEPGRLQSMGLLRVGHDWSDLVAATLKQGGRRVTVRGDVITDAEESQREQEMKIVYCWFWGWRKRP